MKPLLLLLLLTAPPYTGKTYQGMYGNPVQVPASEAYVSTWGLKINRICAGGSAEATDLKIGDILVQFDKWTWQKKKDVRLHKYVTDENQNARPGDVCKVVYLRDGKVHTLDMTLLRYPRTQPEDTPTNAQLRPDLVDAKPSDYEIKLRSLINEHKLGTDFADMLDRLDQAQQFPDPQRLPVMRYVHRDPLKMETVSRELVAVSRTNVIDAAQQALSAKASAMTAPLPEMATLNEHLDYIAKTLAEAADANARALADLTEDERRFIIDHREAMLTAFAEVKMLSYDDDYDRQKNNSRVLDLAGKVHVGPLIEQARIASRLTAPAFLASLRKSIPDLNKPSIAQRNTPHGLIRITGAGRQRHQHICAALYDFGGDDVYAANPGTSVPGKVPTSILVDFDGDDAYESTNHFNIACGDFGVGILVDLKGNDSYIGRWFGQGAGFCGIGVLRDGAGDDIYHGLQYQQGIGHFGAGALIDLGGNDRYESHLASQGVGLPGGFGLLHDAAGDDSYYCKGEQPTGYGTTGVFEGWGQGFGVGYRPYASGGIGVLIDDGGIDRMESGNFCQGGGYYYGLGILFCAGNDDDNYIGSRYAQGFGCHQAVGVMIEAGGNDHYQTRNAVAQGLAWDEAGGLFLDEAGNDRYEGGGFSHGASAHNGFVIFIDRAGSDEYLYTNQARAGGNTYHGGTSMSLFIDQGGEEDKYPSRKNGSVEYGGVHGLFVDE